MFFVVRSNDSFNFPLGLIKYIVIVVIVINVLSCTPTGVSEINYLTEVTEQPFMNSCGSLLKTTSFIQTTAMGQQGLSEDHCLHSNHRTARRQYRGLSEDHSLHPNHRTAVGQHVRPSEDHSLHPNHWTDHLRPNQV